ncbi:unnamed protein product [Miscanthus lutarioriparius]|uniref:Dirigent protein n=1 Tax=Miscanthus lutarioriparius TaxID=422564 RepID=A0A811SQX9_9POAL|nr:unnamed protein product [Miscanthus lutarioriparius]
MATTTPCILQVTPSYAATQGNEFNFSGLYLYHTYKGPNANQVETIVRHQFGTLAVNNWVIRDSLSGSAEVIARTQGLHVNAGDWHNSFSLVFEDEGALLLPQRLVHGVETEGLLKTSQSHQSAWRASQLAAVRLLIPLRFLMLIKLVRRTLQTELSDSEFVKEVFGTFAMYVGVVNVINSIKLVTNVKTYGPFGQETGTLFSVPVQGNSGVASFFGRSGKFLDAIGVYVHPL